MNNLNVEHNIIVESREKASIGGVVTVDEFDENVITLTTTLGDLRIKGENLHVEKLDLQNGELVITGMIYTVEYADKVQKGGFLSGLFR